MSLGDPLSSGSQVEHVVANGAVVALCAGPCILRRVVIGKKGVGNTLDVMGTGGGATILLIDTASSIGTLECNIALPLLSYQLSGGTAADLIIVYDVNP